MAELTGVRVLVTRPRDQARGLVALVEAAGGHVLLFPALEIRPTPRQAELTEIIQHLADYDLAVFISPNAVNHAIEAIHRIVGALPASLDLACVGQGGAAALERHGYRSAIAPRDQANSEALLSLPSMQTMEDRRVVIFRGDGGRDRLRQGLAERGARVVYAECYVRACPDIDPAPLRDALAEGQLDVITLTSAEALRNLVALAGPARERLLALPAIVASPRIAEVGRGMGFRQVPQIAAGASDEAMLAAIKAWRSQGKPL